MTSPKGIAVGRLWPGLGMRAVRLARASAAGGQRVTHGLDVLVLGMLMEIVARVAERQLLAVVERPSPDVAAADQSSSATPAPAPTPALS